LNTGTPPPSPLQLAASANTPTSLNTLNTPVTQAAWADEFGQKITWMATQRNQSAELHLNPPQLGPLDVSLTIKGDQASALFTSPHAAVRDAIEAALPKLREMLADSGIMLGNAMVSDQSAKNGQEHIARKTAGGALADSTADESDLVRLNEARIPISRNLKGIVDTFA
jgi:flagellar hook-length control protein FliK